MQGERPSHFRAIASHLAMRSGSEVVLTFAAIEAIIEEPLPVGAFINVTWWTAASRVHVRMWREHGWRAFPDLARRTVRFIRDTEG